MSANPTRSDWPRGRRGTPVPCDASDEARTTKYAGERWGRALAGASLADDPTTARAVVANDTLAPGRVFAPAEPLSSIDELSDVVAPAPRARSSARVVIAIGLCAFATGIAAQQIWRARSNAPAAASTLAITSALETSTPRRAPIPAAPAPMRSPGASARVEAAQRVVPPSAPSHVLNPIAEAAFAASRAPAAAAPAPAYQDPAVIAELLAELDAPAPDAHAASPRSTRARARPHRHHRHTRARHSLRGIPPNPFD